MNNSLSNINKYTIKRRSSLNDEQLLFKKSNNQKIKELEKRIKFLKDRINKIESLIIKNY